MWLVRAALPEACFGFEVISDGWVRLGVSAP
jgi:hypothetical protein